MEYVCAKSTSLLKCILNYYQSNPGVILTCEIDLYYGLSAPNLFKGTLKELFN